MQLTLSVPSQLLQLAVVTVVLCYMRPTSLSEKSGCEYDWKRQRIIKVIYSTIEVNILAANTTSIISTRHKGVY